MLTEADVLATLGKKIPDSSVLLHDSYLDPNTNTIITTDMMVADQHFSMDYYSPADLGWKAVAVNLSDLAATGGLPTAVLIALGLPATLDLGFVSEFYSGVDAALKAHAVPNYREGFDGRAVVAGGDTVGSKLLTVSVTAMGELLHRYTPGRRNTAQPGDFVFTTGYAGLSAIGLQALKKRWGGFDTAKAQHLRPQAKVDLGLFLSGQARRLCLMDSSDGLGDAVLKLAQASKMKIQIQESALPVHTDVLSGAQKLGLSPLDLLLYGGEDYELVGTVSPSMAAALPGDKFYIIGEVLGADESGSASIVKASGQVEGINPRRMFHHFQPPQQPSSVPADGAAEQPVSTGIPLNPPSQATPAQTTPTQNQPATNHPIVTAGAPQSLESSEAFSWILREGIGFNSQS